MTDMLTARQEAFCRAFVAGGGSAAEAARRAGYSAHTARAQASRLLHTPAVQARIDALRADAEQASAAVCARLMDQTRRLAERAEHDGQLGHALRAVSMQMQLVKQFGLPAPPDDTAERTLDGLGADPAEVCGDVAVGEADPGDAKTAPADVAAATEAIGASFIPPWVAAALRRHVATAVDGCERVAASDGGDAPAESGPHVADRSPPPGNAAHAPELPAHQADLVNGRTAAALRALTDIDSRERIMAIADVPPDGAPGRTHCPKASPPRRQDVTSHNHSPAAPDTQRADRRACVPARADRHAC